MQTSARIGRRRVVLRRPGRAAAWGAAALSIGMMFGLHAAGDIQAAYSQGSIGARPGPGIAVPKTVRASSSAEERALGFALAAAWGASEPADCSAADPAHRQGCLDYLERAESEAQRSFAIPPII